MAQQSNKSIPPPIETKYIESYTRKVSPLDITTTRLSTSTPHRSSFSEDDDMFDTTADTISFQTSRWKNIQHELDTIDDYALLEEIKDLKESYATSKNKIFGDFEIAVFKHYKIENQPQFKLLQERIRSIIIEMNIQNGYNMLNQEVSANNKKDPLLLHVDASYIVKHPSMSKTASMTSINDYSDIKREFKKLMAPLCSSQQNLMEQYLDTSCHTKMKQSENIFDCPCIERICILLKMYYKFQKLIANLRSGHQIELMSEYVSIDAYGQSQNRKKYHMKHSKSTRPWLCSRHIYDWILLFDLSRFGSY